MNDKLLDSYTELSKKTRGYIFLSLLITSHGVLVVCHAVRENV